MSFRLRFVCMIGVALAIILLAPFAPADHSRAQAQTISPGGVVAFAGVDGSGQSVLYVMDLATGSIGRIDSLVGSAPDLAWQPVSDPLITHQVLAYNTQDGGYGLLRGLRGCFDSDALCTDLVEVLPPFMISQLEWSPDGTLLYFATDAGVKTSPPRGRAADIVNLELTCPHGIATSPGSDDLLCVNQTGSGALQPTDYLPSPAGYAERYAVGQFPAVTAFDLGFDGRSAVGTLEAAGDSGFYTSTAGLPVRFANYQVHVYDLEFSPDGTTVAIVGATADSTGDGSLRDGDTAELFLYDTASGVLSQVPGFTGATALTWSPDGASLLVIVNGSNGTKFQIYTLSTRLIATVPAQLPDPMLAISSPAWSPVHPVLTAIPTATPIPTLTPAASLTPFPTFTASPFPTLTPFPTFTPFPTVAPFPTFTPFPSTTPGSPMGIGCQYVYPGGGPPVAVGDTAEVTPYGAAVRLRTNTALDATMIRELRSGTRMTILSGPYCSQGYRWWEARMETDGRTGYLADSDPSGYWIKTVTPAPPAESISFYADATTVTSGQCTTIHWDVEGIKAVYFQGEGVVGHDVRVMCPAAASTFTLRVIQLDDTEVLRQITILVVAP